MKKYIWYPLRTIDGLLDRIMAILGAFLLAQFPHFFNQYLQRLGGHMEEARRTVRHYTQAAENLNLTLEQYVDIHLTAGEEVYVSSGKLISGLITRLEQLEHSFFALKNATPFNRWLVFLQEVDWSIAAHTWQHFSPGVPTTTEGIIYAFLGLLVGWGIYSGIKNLFYLGRNFRRRKPARKQRYTG